MSKTDLVVLEGDAIRMTIPIADLQHIALLMWEAGRMPPIQIDHAEAFAEAFVNTLNYEDEGGNTVLTRALDIAMLSAFEWGEGMEISDAEATFLLAELTRSAGEGPSQGTPSAPIAAPSDSDCIAVPRKLLLEAHALMRATGWHHATAVRTSLDGVLETAAETIERQVALLLHPATREGL